MSSDYSASNVLTDDVIKHREQIVSECMDAIDHGDLVEEDYRAIEAQIRLAYTSAYSAGMHDLAQQLIIEGKL